MGFRSCIDLGLIQLNYKIKAEDDFAKEVKAKYPSLFTGNIGKLRNFELELHIEVIPTSFRTTETHIIPPKRKSRSCPQTHGGRRHNRRRNWSNRVGFGDGANPHDPSEIRVTIDSKKANKAIKRERHNTPNIENLAISINGAKVASKADLREGYHQVILHPKSRPITTFRSSLGLKWYKCLSIGLC